MAGSLVMRRSSWEFGGQFRRFAIGMASIQRSNIGISNIGLVLELALQPLFNRFARTVKHPQRQAQRPHVLGTQRILVTQAKGLHRLNRHGADIKGQHLPFIQAAIFQRVRSVFRLIQVTLGKLARVRNNQTTRLERRQVHLQCSRVHRHQYIWRVACGADLAAAEIDLERGNAEQRALRCANFRWKIREGRQIITCQRGGQRKLTTCQLHTIATIARKTNDYSIGLSGGRTQCGRISGLGRHWHSLSRAN